jgi:hypothetical protein
MENAQYHLVKNYFLPHLLLKNMKIEDNELRAHLIRRMLNIIWLRIISFPFSHLKT